jgi:hypothetical protein
MDSKKLLSNILGDGKSDPPQVSMEKDAQGRFAVGHKAWMSPRGTAKAIQEYINARTNNMLNVIDFHVGVLDGTIKDVKAVRGLGGQVHEIRIAVDLATRQRSAEFLAERCWGKPKEFLEVDSRSEVYQANLDLTALNPEDLLALKRIMTAGGNTSEVVDGNTSEVVDSNTSEIKVLPKNADLLEENITDEIIEPVE